MPQIKNSVSADSIMVMAKLPPDLVRRLHRVIGERKATCIKPCTQREIMGLALGDWLEKEERKKLE